MLPIARLARTHMAMLSAQRRIEARFEALRYFNLDRRRPLQTMSRCH